ncbi:MAG: phosphoribosylamine--glycine ligase [Flavobacteriales bacterium]|nr:phosphoribosylamine--glycine ligase [Flavobacteriales bacterium]
MNVLVLGSGGREHVFVWKLAQSALVDKLFVAPGNAGTSSVCTNVDLKILDFKGIADFCLSNNIDVIIPGSEDPLVAGIADYFSGNDKLNHIFVLGPNKEAAQLEGSKDYAKQFLIENNIPTAQYQTFTSDNIAAAKQYVRTKTAPYVLKADGLAAGKGVVIAQNLIEADATLDDMLLNSKFGAAGNSVVIEDFLDGIEFSVFVLCDGENYVLLPEAKDYKRIGEGDTGLNTGGMGAVSPVPFADKALMDKVVEQIIEPTMHGLKRRNIQYVGFIFFGLINCNGQPKVIEYNVRMGDPETEVVFPRIKNDFGEMVDFCRNKRLIDANIEFESKVCTTIFAVSGGYPEDYEKGKRMTISLALQTEMVFHAGTQKSDNDILTNGGRVVALSAFGNTIADALKHSYQNVAEIKFDGMYYRKDIGKDLLNN